MKYDGQYWTVLKYCFEPNYNNNYPYLAWVFLPDGSNHVWRLPKLGSQYYICNKARTQPSNFCNEINKIREVA